MEPCKPDFFRILYFDAFEAQRLGYRETGRLKWILMQTVHLDISGLCQIYRAKFGRNKFNQLLQVLTP
jgi:hypothetical protein